MFSSHKKSGRYFSFRNKEIVMYNSNVDKFLPQGRIPGRGKWQFLSLVNEIIFPTKHTLPVDRSALPRPEAYIIFKSILTYASK